MKITCSVGTGMQLEQALRDALGVDANSCDIPKGAENVQAASSVNIGPSQELSDCVNDIMTEIGSNANISPAYGMSLGDSSYSWLYEDDDGFLNLVDADGGTLVRSEESYEIVDYVLSTYGKSSVNSASKIYSATEESDWWKEYYEEVSLDKLCEYCGCNPEDVVDASDLDAYDAEHISWLIAKTEYADSLDSLDTVELVKEGGEVFLAEIIGDRLMNATEEIQHNLGLTEYDPPEIEEGIESATNTCNVAAKPDVVTANDDLENNTSYIEKFSECLSRKLNDLGYNLIDLNDFGQYIEVLIDTPFGTEAHTQYPYDDFSWDINQVESDALRLACVIDDEIRMDVGE